MRTLILFHILMTLSIANPLTDLFSVTPKAEVFSITPIETILNQESQFILKGKALTSNTNLEINGFTNCQNNFNSSNEVHFLCTAQSIGRKVGIIKDDTKEIYRFYIDVKSNVVEVPKPEISIRPLKAELNQKTVFTIESTNNVDLPNTLAFWTDQCRDIISLGGTNRERRFSCIPSYSSGSKYGLVKDKSGGTILEEFTILVKDDYRKYIDIKSFAPREVYLNEKTDFTILGENLPENLNVEIDNCSNIQKTISSSWLINFSCTPTSQGNKIVTLRNQDDNLVIANLGLHINNQRNNDFFIDIPSINLTAEKNSTFTLPFLAKYTGNTKEFMTPKIQYYLSEDTILSSSDTIIGETNAYLNMTTNSSEIQEQVYISNEVKKGDYYIISTINSDNKYEEVDKTNNQKYQKITVTESTSSIDVSLPPTYTTFKNQPLSLSASTLNIDNENEATYSWNFGDGSSGSTKTVQHTYSTVGTYTAEVTVTYNGVTKTVTTQVEVKEPTVSNEKDITNWKQILAGRYSDMYFANGRFVAVGAKGNIATSTDGVNWQTISYAKKDDIGDLMAVTYGNGKWVAVGGKPQKGVKVVSSDGLNWVVSNAYPVQKLTDVHFANNLFVSVGEKGIKYSSSDGENWSAGYVGTQIDGSTMSFTSVTYDDVHNTWIAVGTQVGDAIFTSTDGHRWDENSFALSGLRLNSVDSYNGKTIAVGYQASKGILLTSNNGGSTWTSQTIVKNTLAINHTSIGWIGALNNGDIIFSSDGTTWTVEDTNRNQWYTSFVYANSKLLATGHTWNIYEAQPKDSKQEFSIALSVHDGGVVTYNGGSCNSGSCTPILAKEGDTVVFDATPSSGYKFKYWLGDCSGDGKCSLNMSSNKRIEAHFSKLETLTVTKPLDGYVSSTDEHIKCGESFNQCSYEYVEGNSVQLVYHESANVTNRFKSWGGDINSLSKITTVVMSTNKNVSVTTKLNTAPTITMNSELNVTKNQSTYLDFIVNDTDGDIVQSRISENPRLGTVILAGNRVIYTPNQNFGIGDGFTLEFNDGHGGIVQKNVKITELIVNIPPTVSTDSNLTVFKNSNRVIRFDMHDENALDIVAVTVSTPPPHGTIEFYSGNTTYTEFKYMPNTNYVGDDTLTVKADDRHGGVVYLTIALSVTEAPIIDTDNDGIPNDKELELGLNPNSNDSDGDGYLDSEEIGDINNPRNTDGTDEIDALDTDSDNDGVLDRVEREEGTDYLDDGDKPETLGITLEKSSVKLGLGLRDKNITINISDMQGGELKVTVTNEEQAMLITTQQWADEWLPVGDYEDKELLLTLKGLKAESGLISIEVRDRFGHTKTEDIVVEVIEIADFVESRSSEQMNLSDANATCMDMGARLPNIQELRDAYQLVDNYIDLKGIRTPIWGSTPSPSGSGYYSYITQNGIDGHWGYADREDANKYVHCVKVQTPVIDTNLVTVKLNAGWNNVALSPMTLEELITKVGVENLLIIQGALPQSSYRKLFVDQGRAYLNSFKKIEYGQGYWIKVNEAVEFTYSKVKYSGRQEVALKAGWNNVASLYGLSLEEIQANLGVDNVLIIQGALPQSSYRKLFVDQGRAYLNSFKKFEPNQGYWIKLDHEAKLVYEFELTEVARSNSNNEMISTETINGTEYTIKLFTNSQPQIETTNGAIVVFGLIDGTNITMGLNSSYPSDSKFQVAVYNSNGDEVNRSEIVDFFEDSIDFGSIEL